MSLREERAKCIQRVRRVRTILKRDGWIKYRYFDGIRCCLTAALHKAGEPGGLGSMKGPTYQFLQQKLKTDNLAKWNDAQPSRAAVIRALNKVLGE